MPYSDWRVVTCCCNNKAVNEYCQKGFLTTLVRLPVASVGRSDFQAADITRRRVDRKSAALSVPKANSNSFCALRHRMAADFTFATPAEVRRMLRVRPSQIGRAHV